MITATSNKSKTKTKKQYIGLSLYVLPAMVFFLVFKYWPLIYSFILSFKSWNFIGKMKSVGWSNFTNMLGKEIFSNALLNTLLYIVGLLPFFIIIPLLLALLLLNVKPKKLQNTYRTLFFIPTVLAFSIICLVWMWIFNPSFGLLNNFFKLFGSKGYAWLSDQRTAMLSIIAISGWKFMGSNMILFIAGLLTVPKDYIEAAKIDGASSWQIFWNVKWPLISSTTIYLVMTSVIFAAERAFTPINVLTNGGPGNATTNLSHAIYLFGFKYFNIGLASATAIFTSVFFLIITIFMMKSVGGFSYYEN
ncbi:MAG: sugar ABC transporter permease [Eubacteriales bacterium]|nr:sugar ABC transporter permease [Eubacteriales bacterium]